MRLTLLFIGLFMTSLFAQVQQPMTQLVPKLRSIAHGSATDIWAIDFNNNVWHWQNGGFVPYEAVLSSISVGNDGAVWGIGLHGSIHKIEDRKFTQIPGAMKAISVGSKDHIWGIGDDGSIWKHTGDKWLKQSGKADQISAGSDGSVYILKKDASLWKLSQGDWLKQGGELKKVIVVDTQNLFGLNFLNQPVKLQNNTWEIISKIPAEDLSVATDGTIWTVSANGQFKKIK